MNQQNNITDKSIVEINNLKKVMTKTPFNLIDRSLH
jgi:hypothetical protein